MKGNVMCRKMLIVCFIGLVVGGCSQKGEENALKQTVDYGTGKTQVDTYQRLKGQIHAIHEEQVKRTEQ